MDNLTEYSFTKPSRSRYAEVPRRLFDQNVFAVKLKRGVDFSEDAKMNSIQGAVSTLINESPHNTDNRRARTFVESDDVLIVSLWPKGQEPTKRRKKTRQAVAA